MNDLNRQKLGEHIQNSLQRQRRIARWSAFALNAIFFLISLILVILVLSDPTSYAAAIPVESREIFIVPLALWFIAVCSHLVSALTDSGMIDREMRERAVTEALNQQIIEEALGGEKPKRDTARLDADAVTINDEGELVPLDEVQRKQK